ncbi:MAG: GNAT family N-acetyltransferase, partial [Terriglobales bacterium]
ARAPVAAAIWNYLARWPACDVLELRHVPAGGCAAAILAAAAASGSATGRWLSPFQTCVADRLAPRTSRKFRAELRRTRRHLEARAPLRLDLISSASPEALQSFFQLEAAGWKGRAGGNAILRKPPAVRRFYQLLASHAAARGHFVLARLCSGEHPVAMSYCLRDAHACWPIRWCYDEAYANFSPGHLLIESMLNAFGRLCIAGEPFAYERKWAPEGVPQAFLYVFPPTARGRLLHVLKCGFRPDPSRQPSDPAAAASSPACPPA